MWLKNTNISESEKYIIQFDIYKITQNSVYIQLNEILENYVKNNNNNLEIDYKSAIKADKNLFIKNTSSKTKHILDKAQGFVNEIDYIRQDTKNLWKLLAYFNKYEMVNSYCPFHWFIDSDKKKSTIFSCYITNCMLLQ